MQIVTAIIGGQVVLPADHGIPDGTQVTITVRAARRRKHDYTAIEADVRTGMTYAAIGEKHGVSVQVVAHVVKTMRQRGGWPVRVPREKRDANAIAILARMLKKITAAEAARRIGVNATTVAKWMDGTLNPSASACEKIRSAAKKTRHGTYKGPK